MYRTRFSSALAMAVLAALLLPSSLHAQITFERTYGGTSNDFGFSVQQTLDGGYIIAGYTFSLGVGHSDVYLIKTEANGDTLWTRTFGDTAYDYGYSVQQTADSGYIIAGYAVGSPATGNGSTYVVKTDARGNTLWTRTYDRPGDDRGYSVQPTADGNLIIGGICVGEAARRVYLMNISPTGDTLWTRTYGSGSTKDYYGQSVQQTADSGYIIAGYVCSYGHFVGNVYLVKTDANGDTLWTRNFDIGGDDEAYSVQQTLDGGYIVAGWTDALGAGSYDVYLLKIDSGGGLLWNRVYGDTGIDQGYSVEQTADCGYIIAAYSYCLGAGHSDVYLIKTDAAGDTVWTRTFGGTGYDYSCSVRRTTDGGYIVSGYTGSFGVGGMDVYLIKTDSLGNVAASVAEQKVSPARAPGLSLSCEPNPFRARTAISLQLTADSKARLAVFDASGRYVRTLTANRTSCAVWDGTGDLDQPLPSGA